jgi:cytoskeletal protein RodZ
MVDDPLKQLGETFKKARLQSGLSLDDLSEKSRIQVRHIGNIEKANRIDLPEEAYLMGYLNKLSKILKLKNPQVVMDEYKKGESQYIVQNILNENHIKNDSLPFNISFLRIYHLYILIGALVILGIFYLINSTSSKDSNLDKKLITISKLETRKPTVIPDAKVINIENLDLEIKVPEPIVETQEQSSKNNSDSPFSIYGEGSKSLKISILEVAWFQVYGIGASKALFEGDGYPNVEPNKFEFRDDIGFTLSSGNAGAFKVHDAGKKYILGKSGQLIKWYYPEGAKYEYKQRAKH